MNSYFKTESLNIVAWLLSKNINIKKTIDMDGSLIFLFDNTNELQKQIDKYNENDELRKFIASFKKVKTIVKKNKAK